MNKNANFSAFKDLKTSNSNLEKFLDDKLQANEDELFDEVNFGFDTKKLQFSLRKNNPVFLLTSKIVESLKKTMISYNYEVQVIRRELTTPHEGVANEGLDNVENDLVVSFNDVITSPDNVSYKIIEQLGKIFFNSGKGSSGQVFKCVRELDQKELAIKIIKNKKTFTNMSLRELRILEFLNTEVDPQDLSHIIRKYDHFIYKKHMCIIFELLNHNLLELLMKNNYCGLTLKTIGFILKQILEGIYQFSKINIIHCDLKPENILIKLKKSDDINIKITDFGSACFKKHTIATYIQSRYYRAPEVLVTYGYSAEIDMWSLGCVAAELFIGNPFFPGCNEFDQLLKIISICGPLPGDMTANCAKREKFYKIDNQTKYPRIKTKEEYYQQYPNEVPKVYYDIPLKIKSFDDFHRIHKQRHEPQNPERLSCFIHLLKGLLNVDPKHRWNVKQALLHPFITGEVFTGKPTFNKGNFNPTNAEISMMIFPSLETTYRSEREIVYNSMIMENNFNNLNSCNDSVDCSNYRPNVGRIPMRKLKDFPKIIPLKLEYMVNSNKKGKFNKFDDQHNNTFMMTSFDKLNSSTYEDTMVQGYRHRKLKKEGSSKKTSKFKPMKFNKFDIAANNKSMSFERYRHRERSNSDYNNFFSNSNNNSSNMIQMNNYGSIKNSFNGLNNNNVLNNSFQFKSLSNNSVQFSEKNGILSKNFKKKSSIKNKEFGFGKLERIESAQVFEDEDNMEN